MTRTGLAVRVIATYSGSVAGHPNLLNLPPEGGSSVYHILSPPLISQNRQGGGGLRICSSRRWQRIGTTSPLAVALIFNHGSIKQEELNFGSSPNSMWPVRGPSNYLVCKSIKR